MRIQGPYLESAFGVSRVRFDGSNTGLVPAIKDGVGGVAAPKSTSAIAHRLYIVGLGLDDTSWTWQSSSWYFVIGVELRPRCTTPRILGHIAIESSHRSLYRSIASLFAGSGTSLKIQVSPPSGWLERRV